ncbi:hypothetical protein B0I27_103254 [Arcticibacter pallidicorallinus]|uniref:Uncharacterized protein n=1 Tax=Arcticibacter pallidicorallinus TaxID=1259464 RepID=A0A2T0U794_9SPHI|nr:hypothetical protein [Arcticibacter pallidicorallinus]PRY53784.1 hypothetical protein B0I27_103254 [Arcticibacter pallidicorallinus]
MKKTLIAALLLAGLATSGIAQEKAKRTQNRHGGQLERFERGRNRIASPEQQARQATDRLDKQLSLSDKQKSEVYKINLKRAKNMAVAREKSQKQRLQQLKQMESERADNEKRLSRVLNSQQQAKYASLKQSRAEKLRDRKGSSIKRQKNVAKRDSSNRRTVEARRAR